MEVYGYAYVTKQTTNILRSTVYKSLRGKFIPQENIRVDVLESLDGRNVLKTLIYEEAQANDTILILNKYTLGNTVEFRKWWQEIRSAGVNLLIVDEEAPNGVDYYSTTDYSLERYAEEQITERWEKLQTEVFERTTQKVGRKSAILTNAFKEAYWAFQAFAVSADEAYSHAGVSKPTFYMLCKEYETTDEYKETLLSKKELLEYPKRGGLGKEMDKLFFAVEQQRKTLSEACEELEIATMLPEEYHRCLLAKQGGRKIQFDMEKEHYTANYFELNQ